MHLLVLGQGGHNLSHSDLYAGRTRRRDGRGRRAGESKPSQELIIPATHRQHFAVLGIYMLDHGKNRAMLVPLKAMRNEWHEKELVAYAKLVRKLCDCLLYTSDAADE